MSGNNETRPTVVFINHWAAHLGGAEYSLIDILAGLAGRAEIHLFTSESGTLLYKLEHAEVACHVIPSAPSLINVKRGRLVTSLLANIPALIGFSRHLIRMRSRILALQPDCIHANVPKSHIALCILRLTGVRCRSIIHFREIFDRASPAYLLYSTLFRLCGAVSVIAISRAVRDALPPIMKKNAEIIYNGVFVPPSAALPRRRHITPPVRFMYIGRIVPWKGCDLLVDAFARFRRQCGNAGTLVLFGRTSYWDASYRDALQGRITDAGLGDAITLGGHTENPYEEYRRHDVLCVPSVNEPFGRVAAEAQACGLPVIALKSGGIQEIVVHNETGYIVECANAGALADAMIAMAHHPEEIIRMGRNGRERAAVLFNSKCQVPAIVNRILAKQ